MSDASDRALALWKELIQDRDLIPAIRASEHPDCRWLNTFIEEVVLPAVRRRSGWEWTPDDNGWPLFLTEITRATKQAQRELAEVATFWQPKPSKVVSLTDERRRRRLRVVPTQLRLPGIE